MKFASPAACLLAVSTWAHAGTPVPEAEVPEPVTTAIEEFFPGAELLTAERDRDDGRTEYEVHILYKDINLEVDVRPEGEIVDVDMED